MHTHRDRYVFAPGVAREEVQAALLLAGLATESLHGPLPTGLATAPPLDPLERSCVIEVTTPVGRDLSRLFAGFLRRECGPEAFVVERLEVPRSLVPEAAT